MSVTVASDSMDDVELLRGLLLVTPAPATATEKGAQVVTVLLLLFIAAAEENM